MVVNLLPVCPLALRPLEAFARSVEMLFVFKGTNTLSKRYITVPRSWCGDGEKRTRKTKRSLSLHGLGVVMSPEESRSVNLGIYPFSRCVALFVWYLMALCVL